MSRRSRRPFGVSVIHDQTTPQTLTHNLRTAVLDPTRTPGQDLQRTATGPPRCCSAICAMPADGSRPAALGVHAGRASRDPASDDAARGAAISQSPAVQHRAAAGTRNAAKLSRRRATRHGALSRGGALGGGDPRAARISAAGPQLRIDRRARSRALRVSAAGTLGIGRAIARPRPPRTKARLRAARALALSYVDPYVDFTGRVTGYAVVDLRVMGGYDWRLSDRNVWKVERMLLDAPHRPIRSSDARIDRLRRRYKEFWKPARPQARGLPRTRPMDGDPRGELVIW